MIKKILYSIFALSLLASCAIENDIPYPQIVGSITAFEVEGQRGPEDNEDNAAAVIDANARTVTVYVNDSVDVRELKITRLALDPRDAALLVDSALCDDAEHFPFEHFASLDSIPVSSNTRVDFSNPVNMTVRTYQDYVWKVEVEQIIKRDIDVEGMTSKVVDVNSRNVIIYVAESEDLSNIQIKQLDLGGEFGETRPASGGNVTDVHDFSKGYQTFYARLSWEPEGQYTTWKVFVYPDENGGSSSSNSDVFARVTSATLTGSITSGKTPVVEYKEQSASDWQTVSDVTVASTKYTANITGLSASTTYSYRVSVDGVAGAEKTFTTVAATPLENGSFDEWSSEAANNGTLWMPWTTTSFWDTGNRGATTIGDSNSTPTEETCNGSGRAAALQTKWVVLKLAAGNIFTGTYVRTDGTNGILSFGRPFTSFPTKLRINYKYTSSTINRVGDDDMSFLEGRADSCHIYIALTDWDQPYEIRTRKAERQLFDKNDSHVIAYAEHIQGSSDVSYQQKDLVLEYRYTNRTPKYILIVASASKYGDYFTGGDQSRLLVDNFELIYE